MEPLTLYLTLLVAGFVLIGAEIFIPGGILGIFGSMIWIAAAVIGWKHFPAPWNMLSALSLLLAGALTFVIWIKFFPKSRMGKTLSLQVSGEDNKSHTTTEALPIGTAGEALSTLRPSGIASFDGRRVDVITDGEWIEAGQAIKISSTTDGHISVIKI